MVAPWRVHPNVDKRITSLGEGRRDLDGACARAGHPPFGREQIHARIPRRGRTEPDAKYHQALEQQLDPRRFVRVHRGEIVTLDAVVKLEPWSHGNGILVLKDGFSVISSRTHREAFLRRWGG